MRHKNSAQLTPKFLVEWNGAVRGVATVQKKGWAASGQLLLPFTSDGLGLPRFWQPRFYDFNVYSRYKLREKLEYMHANPVKRGLVKNPGAWMWSSFLFYEKGQPGLVEIDPVGSLE